MHLVRHKVPLQARSLKKFTFISNVAFPAFILSELFDSLDRVTRRVRCSHFKKVEGGGSALLAQQKSAQYSLEKPHSASSTTLRSQLPPNTCASPRYQREATKVQNALLRWADRNHHHLQINTPTTLLTPPPFFAN